ncbi:22326_t:CDS:2, partial [Cetraspora pellucida]
MPIWNDYDEGEEDGHGHFGATNCLLWDTVLSMNIKGDLLETYSETCWVFIYDTMNSIIYVKPAIDK